VLLFGSFKGVDGDRRRPRRHVVVATALAIVVVCAGAAGVWRLRSRSDTSGPAVAVGSLRLATSATVTVPSGHEAPFTATAIGPASFVPGRDVRIQVTLASPKNQSMVLEAGTDLWTGRVSGSLGAVEAVGPVGCTVGLAGNPVSCSSDPFFLRLGPPSTAWPGGTGGTVPAAHTILVHTTDVAPGRYVLPADMQYAPITGPHPRYEGTATVRVILDISGSIRMAALQDPRRRISLRYPSNWHVATKAISADPSFAAAFATLPLPSSGARCEGRPQAVLDTLGPNDAFVYIELFEGNPYNYGVRPARFSARSGLYDEGPKCPAALTNRRYDQWISFREGGYGVTVSIAFGDHATRALQVRVYQALDTLKIAAT
jgi:hypothetical protein